MHLNAIEWMNKSEWMQWMNAYECKLIKMGANWCDYWIKKKEIDSNKIKH